MLIIRREQVEAFRRAAVLRFERDLMTDLQRAYPARYAQFGDDAVLKVVREAVKRLAAHGISDEDDVASLAELDFTLGQPFERQKGQEWAGEILRDQTIIPGARVALIFARQPRADSTTT